MLFEVTYREDNLFRVILHAETEEQAKELALEGNKPATLLDRELEIIDIQVEPD